MDKKIDFLYQSISDTQSSIRSADIKVSFVSVILVLPLTKMATIYQECKGLISVSSLFWIIILFCIILWLLSMITFLTTLIAISDPRKHILAKDVNGIFYKGGLFQFNFFDLFFNYRNHSKESLDDLISSLPHNDEAIIKELTFEKMKLSYIRDIKFKRSSFCMVTTWLWVLIGCLIWFLSIVY